MPSGVMRAQNPATKVRLSGVRGRMPRAWLVSLCVVLVAGLALPALTIVPSVLRGEATDTPAPAGKEGPASPEQLLPSASVSGRMAWRSLPAVWLSRVGRLVCLARTSRWKPGHQLANGLRAPLLR